VEARELRWSASMRPPVMLCFALAVTALLAVAPATVFYLPGVAPNDFLKDPLQPQDHSSFNTSIQSLQICSANPFPSLLLILF